MRKSGSKVLKTEFHSSLKKVEGLIHVELEGNDGDSVPIAPQVDLEAYEAYLRGRYLWAEIDEHGLYRDYRNKTGFDRSHQLWDETRESMDRYAHYRPKAATRKTSGLFFRRSDGKQRPIDC